MKLTKINCANFYRVLFFSPIQSQRNDSESKSDSTTTIGTAVVLLAESLIVAACAN